MGLFSFIKEAGEKLFNGKEVEQQVAQAQTGAAPEQASASLNELSARAAAAIKTYIEQQGLGLSELAVCFDARAARVTLTGQAPSQEAAEKAGLAAGNVSHVNDVDNQLQFPAGTASQFHDVVKGDTLSAIAKKYYGDANKYMRIFEANKPMLSHPDKIYPGQKLRIPPL